MQYAEFDGPDPSGLWHIFGNFLLFDLTREKGHAFSAKVPKVFITMKVALCRGSLDCGYGSYQVLHVC
jgi:hypothetical protein